MAASNANKGHCYLCGQELAKASMQKHLTAKHASEENGQECFLLKVESEDADHWLFVDIAASSTLSALDRFLRKIWLECCGHLSMFYLPGRYGDRVGMSTKIDSLNVGFTLMYDYDFGSETTLKIKFIKKMFRPAQRSVVRLLARNDPYEYDCCECGEHAEYVDAGAWPPELYCESCAERLDGGYLLPVVNSPRMGVCGYTGEFDTFEYRPSENPKGE